MNLTTILREISRNLHAGNKALQPTKLLSRTQRVVIRQSDKVVSIRSQAFI